MLKIIALTVFATSANAECAKPMSPPALRQQIYEIGNMRQIIMLPMDDGKSMEVFTNDQGLWAQLFLDSKTEGCLMAFGEGFMMIWPFPHPENP